MSVLHVVQFEDVKKRYVEKIALCEGIDPYTIGMDERMVFDDLPKVALLDIWNYFTSMKSSFSNDEYHANKALGAHRFFDGGWVRKIVTRRLPNNKIVVVGLVEHSQRISETPMKPWVLCQSAGMILAAHCTCIAGLGETCSHVGAILYAIEALVRSAENQSKTDFPCQWNHPGSSTIQRFLPLAEMSFAKTEKLPQPMHCLEEFTKDEIFEWLKENKEKANTIAPLTLVTPGLNEEFIKRPTERKMFNVQIPAEANIGSSCTNDSMATNDNVRVILQSLINIFYKVDYQGMELQELLEIVKSINVQMSTKNIELIKRLTVKQSGSWLWEKLRVGRITGSVFKSVCITNPKKLARSTLMKMCYPEKTRFTSKATKHGNDMEPFESKMFIESMESEHINFTCVQNGLVIDALCSFFAVSPDGTCKCDCCGTYLVEIKCPHSMSSKDATIEDLLNLKDPCISLVNGTLTLNRKHSYFYQLQIQMAV